MILFFTLFFNFFTLFFNFFSKNYLISNGSQVYAYFFVVSGVLVSLYLVFISSTKLTSSLGLSLFFMLFFLVFMLNYFNSPLLFFFTYEFFFLPSLLIIYYYSPNIRFLAALSYFTVWTQVGSIFLLFSVVYMYLFNFNVNSLYFTKSLPFLPSFFLCIGLGVKVPVWPFHFWLTKTHVEAPTFFSIYLSGFLVKTAVMGFLVVLPHLNSVVYNLFIVIVFLGVVDSTLKFICQVDLKKLVAYTTIQEMNMILLFVFLDYRSSIIFIGSFILIHTILSSLFFYIVDIIYRKYRGRTVNSVSGIFNVNYLLGSLIFIAVLLFTAFPFTFKFFVELKFYSVLFNFNPFMCLFIIFLVSFLGNFFFLKIWLNVLFGNPGICLSFFLKKKDVLFFLYFFSTFSLLSVLVWFL